MNLSNEESLVIKALFKNKRTKANTNIEDMIYTDVKNELINELKFSREKLNKILLALEKRGLIVVYFDCAYINLSDNGEKIAKNL